MRMDGLDKSFPEVTMAYCPHPTIPKKFIPAAEIESGEESRWSTSLVGRMPLNYASVLFELANRQQSFDMQLHFGECFDLSDFNQYTMAIILEGVRINNYTTDQLGALQADEVAMVNETVGVTAASVSYIYAPTLTQVGEEVTIDGGVVGLTSTTGSYCKSSSIPLLFGLKLPTAGTGNDIYIIYSEDNGANWYDVLLDCSATLSASPLSTYNITSDEQSLYITLNESSGVGHLFIVKIEDVLNNTSGTPIYSTLDNTNAIYASKAFGKIVVTVGQSGTVNMINANTLVYYSIPHNNNDNLYAIDGFSQHDFLVGGDNGLLMLYNSNNGFRTIAVSGVTEAITAVAMLDDDNWIVGTESGKIVATINAGKTWSVKEVFATCINDIKFVNSIVDYALLQDTLYRTINSGYSWSEISDTLGEIPTSTELLGLTAIDANTIFAYGRIPGGSVPNPCDPLNLFLTGDVGVIMKGSV